MQINIVTHLWYLHWKMFRMLQWKVNIITSADDFPKTFPKCKQFHVAEANIYNEGRLPKKLDRDAPPSGRVWYLRTDVAVLW